MANSCAGCRKAITTTSQTLICSSCKVNYHPECVNKDYRSLSKNAILSWTCPSCQSKIPKTDNTNTPLRPQAASNAAASSGDSSKSNVTLRPQNRESERLRSQSPALTPENEALIKLTKEIKLMRDDMTEIKNHLKQLSACVTSCASRLDDYDVKLTTVDDKIRALERKGKQDDLENALLQQRVRDLEDTLSEQAQALVRNEIEIQGITEHKSENLLHIVKVAAHKIGMELADSDIDEVVRVGPRRGTDTQNSKLPLPRPVVLRFVRHMKRQDFLKAARSRRNMTTEDIEVAGRSSKLFFNERLTKEKRRLFRLARQEKSAQGYKYCWTANGQIFIRKREGGPAIVIRGAADFDRVREKDPDPCPAPPEPMVPADPLEGLPTSNSPAIETFRDEE